MPRHGDTVELNEMVRRLEELKATLPSDESKGSGTGMEEAFLDLEASFLRRLDNVQTMIQNINSGPSDVNRIVEQIRQKRNVHSELQAIGEIMKRMNNMIEKEKQRKRKKVSDEEMQRRETNFQSFAQLLKKVQDSLRNEKTRFGELDAVSRTAISKDELLGTGVSSGLGGISSMAARGAGIGLMDKDYAGGGGVAGLSAAQQQTLIEIQQRDQEQDLIIEEIGTLIAETARLAETIHKEIETQNEMLNSTEKNMGETRKNVGSTTEGVKKTLRSKGMSWERVCIVFFCVVVILGIVGVLVSGV